MRSGTEWIMSDIGPFCRTSPLTRVVMIAASVSSSVSMTGPTGQKVSKPFARVHCPSVFCRSRAVTSLATV